MVGDAVKDDTTRHFLEAMNEVEVILSSDSFVKRSITEKGLACWVEFANESVLVEFSFGPPEWHVNMIIRVSNMKYEFKDLLKIPVVNEWVRKNRHKQRDLSNIRDELMWFVELMKISLREIETN
ncbi:MAG: hypothetical protein IPM63_07875 [Acidobacteriota bacterium]|nr:MAG: hypothetical protein IPM63_07875 [Acidobacteriota bacterium]